MHRLSTSAVIFLLISLLVLPGQAQDVRSLIPQPTSMQGLPGLFSLSPKVKISSSPAFADVAQLWSEQTFGKVLTVAPLPGSSVPTAQVVFEQKKIPPAPARRGTSCASPQTAFTSLPPR